MRSGALTLASAATPNLSRGRFDFGVAGSRFGLAADANVDKNSVHVGVASDLFDVWVLAAE
jgi:hypothetical protein